jgi:tetratricopeptide (TPR) repeat protein
MTFELKNSTLDRKLRARRAFRRISQIASGSMFLLAMGCTTTPGTRTSIWPTKKMGAESAAAASGASGTIASTTKAVKGQFASVGTAMSSAYGKAKTAITSPFGATETAATSDSVANTNAPKPTIGPELYVMNGQLHESQGNYAKAIDSYSKALEIEPKNSPALLSTARLYERQNEKDKAVEFYQKASAVTPNNATIYAELGNLHARSGNQSAAREQLQKAVNLEPKNTGYRSSLAGVLLDTGNTDGAMSELMQVNSPAMANYQMAYLHFARKNVPATQQYLGNALQIDPNLKPARDLMASMGGAQSITQMASTGQGMLQQAQGIYNQAGAIGNNVQSLMRTAPAGVMPTNAPSAVGAMMPSSPVPASTNGFSLPAPTASSIPSYESAGAPSTTIRR